MNDLRMYVAASVSADRFQMLRGPFAQSASTSFRRYSARLVIAIVILSFAASPANACTTFCARGLFGRNYDWNINYGLVTVNKRGMSKSSTADVNPAKWISRYGSFTFNQYGRDNATGGMNEAGLVVEIMWLDEAKYPRPDGRAELGALEWVQYQLDNASTVAEVIASGRKVRIRETAAPLHFLIADAKGNRAAIEFLNGELVAHRDAVALANDPFVESVKAMKSGARDRFASAANGVAGARSVSDAFQLLDKVAQPHTVWSIVYDIPNRRVVWRTSGNRALRWVDFAAFDFGCGTPVRFADIHQGKGDIAALFRDYDSARNLSLIRKSVADTPFLSGMAEAEVVKAAQWPERSQCVISRGR